MHSSALGSTPISSNSFTASILPAKTADNNAFSWYDSPWALLKTRLICLRSVRLPVLAAAINIAPARSSAILLFTHIIM